jgi:adenylate kinase family enzyme
MTDTRNDAMLLLGPTGSGKTPLGDLLDRRGLGGRRCVHFDFGAHLRQIVERELPRAEFSPAEVDFLRQVLRSGALLEKQHLPLAERILRGFLASRGVDRRTLVVLNGLPRHVGQVGSVDAILNVAAVIHLDCGEETVLARLGSNVGGDRSARADDQRKLVRRKLAIFAERTAPLVEHYAKLGAMLKTISVTAAMDPESAWRMLIPSRRE